VRHRTDADWETLGSLDPYWAVLTDETFRGLTHSDSEKVSAFLGSGQQHVATLWDAVESQFGPFTPDRALDFGCGVGRVTIPLASRCREVVGVDVADSMLAHARELCGRLNVTNARFLKIQDTLAGLDGRFDFVHSYIVFQHIPQRRGLRLLREVVDHLNENGVGAIHVMYYHPGMGVLPIRLMKHTWRMLKRPFSPLPQMQMNAYSLSAVFRVVQDCGIRQIHVLPTDHGGCLGAMLLFRRVARAPYLLDGDASPKTV